jgi:anti-sigma28 factor (negative regulator of flagellin synthesis)
MIAILSMAGAAVGATGASEGYEIPTALSTTRKTSSFARKGLTCAGEVVIFLPVGEPSPSPTLPSAVEVAVRREFSNRRAFMPRIGDVAGQADGVGGARRAQGKRGERSAAARREEGGGKAPSASSQDVSEMRAHQARLIEAAKNAPDVRADRVAQAKARVREGFYDRPETRAAVADRLLQSFGVKSRPGG